MPVDLQTPDELRYQYFPFRNGITYFRVSAPNDAHIALTGEPNETRPMIEVFIGGWGNTKSVIRFNQTKPDVVEVPTPNILSPHEQRGFYISVSPDGMVEVGREGGPAFLSWRNPEPFHINYFGVCTGWGASGNWYIDDRPEVGGNAPYTSAPSYGGGGGSYGGGAPCWIPASNGELPPGAVEGGMDGEPTFVARARHEGDLIPAKFVPSHRVAYVPYAGGEHPHSEYEVLAGCNPRWVPTQGNNIPPQAVPAGQTSDGETLFVGRVNHDGALTIGKVQPSHGVCYCPYGGQEMAFQSYEILTY